MALVAPTITATLAPAVIAEVMQDATSEAFSTGTQEVQVKVACEDPKLRANRSYDVKQCANDARTKAGLPIVNPDTGYVIRSRTKLAGKTLTVTLYWGRKVSQEA
jgi:hypothetical protein